MADMATLEALDAELDALAKKYMSNMIGMTIASAMGRAAGRLGAKLQSDDVVNIFRERVIYGFEQELGSKKPDASK